MSGALDDDTRRSLAAGRETAGELLRAAQKDLQKVFIVFLIGFMGSFYALRGIVWPFLKRTTEARMSAQTAQELEIIAQTPFDVILIQAKIGMAVGILMALPPFLYYARDALKRRGWWPSSPVARWKLAAIALMSVVLFTVGMAYGYAVFFPVMFQFLANNALQGGFQPHYSIVMWVQFILLLSLSFGLAAQMPLAMVGLAYAEIVPYETFRDKWRHAVVGIFAFGALFSPPDPFTQIMWAAPLIGLYAASLYLTKLVITTKRGSEQIDVKRTARAHWNLLAGTAVAGFVALYAFYTRGGVAAVNDVLANYSAWRVMSADALLPLPGSVTAALIGVVFGLIAAGIALMYFLGVELDAAVESGDLGDPTSIDLSTLDVSGIRAAPPEAFAELSEDEALAQANQAMDEGDHEKAQAILDRYDEVEELELGEEEAAGEGGAEAAAAEGEEGLGDRASRATGTFFEEMSEGETEEDEIGGYYTDLRFILDSLSSKIFHLMVVFMGVLAVTFGWLYSGGIGQVKRDFLNRLPEQVADPSAVGIIALHPVEALLFEVKFSTLMAALAVLPFLAYYAWPALRDRGFVRGHRYVIFGWVAALLVGLFAGFALGYSYIAPSIISYLVADALAADIVIAYRITNFFWLIFFTTVGVGLLADIPILMVLLNTAGVSYQSIRGRWREVTVGIMAFAAIFTPASISTMFLLTIPLMCAYGVGIALVFVLTMGGHKDLTWLLQS